MAFQSNISTSGNELIALFENAINVNKYCIKSFTRHSKQKCQLLRRWTQHGCNPINQSQERFQNEYTISNHI